MKIFFCNSYNITKNQSFVLRKYGQTFLDPFLDNAHFFKSIATDPRQDYFQGIGKVLYEGRVWESGHDKNRILKRIISKYRLRPGRKPEDDHSTDMSWCICTLMNITTLTANRRLQAVLS